MREIDKENEWVNDPDVQDFLERADKQGPIDLEHDKIHTVGGLTNDKAGDFMKFQKKVNIAYKHGWEIEAEQIEIILTEASGYNLIESRGGENAVIEEWNSIMGGSRSKMLEFLIKYNCPEEHRSMVALDMQF